MTTEQKLCERQLLDSYNEMICDLVTFVGENPSASERVWSIQVILNSLYTAVYDGTIRYASNFSMDTYLLYYNNMCDCYKTMYQKLCEEVM